MIYRETARRLLEKLIFKMQGSEYEKKDIELAAQVKSLIRDSYRGIDPIESQWLQDAGVLAIGGAEISLSDAKELTRCILEEILDKCSKTRVYSWNFATWYVLSEILRTCGVKPRNDLDAFINMFLLGIKFEDLSDTFDERFLDPLAQDKEILSRNAKLISSLGVARTEKCSTKKKMKMPSFYN